MKKVSDCVSSETWCKTPPENGVIEFDLEMLAGHDICFKQDGSKLLFWSAHSNPGNQAFRQAAIDMVNAAEYDGIESHVMFNAINAAELRIRLVRAFQGRSSNEA